MTLYEPSQSSEQAAAPQQEPDRASKTSTHEPDDLYAQIDDLQGMIGNAAVNKLLRRHKQQSGDETYEASDSGGGQAPNAHHSSHHRQAPNAHHGGNRTVHSHTVATEGDCQEIIDAIADGSAYLALAQNAQNAAIGDLKNVNPDWNAWAGSYTGGLISAAACFVPESVPAIFAIGALGATVTAAATLPDHSLDAFKDWANEYAAQISSQLIAQKPAAVNNLTVLTAQNKWDYNTARQKACYGLWQDDVVIWNSGRAEPNPSAIQANIKRDMLLHFAAVSKPDWFLPENTSYNSLQYDNVGAVMYRYEVDHVHYDDGDFTPGIREPREWKFTLQSVVVYTREDLVDVLQKSIGDKAIEVRHMNVQKVIAMTPTDLQFSSEDEMPSVIINAKNEVEYVNMPDPTCGFQQYMEKHPNLTNNSLGHLIRDKAWQSSGRQPPTHTVTIAKVETITSASLPDV